MKETCGVTHAVDKKRRDYQRLKEMIIETLLARWDKRRLKDYWALDRMKRKLQLGDYRVRDKEKCINKNYQWGLQNITKHFSGLYSRCVSRRPCTPWGWPGLDTRSTRRPPPEYSGG